MRSTRMLSFLLPAFLYGAGPSLLAAAAPAASGVRTAAPPEVLKAAEETHTKIYRRLAPAVVGLICDGTAPNGAPGQYYGTGVVVSPDGLILSSVTVIPADGKNVRVYFTDGHVRDAQVKKFDRPSEGVLLKVEAKDLTFMRLADSSTYRVGDPVYSWGNPHFTIQRDGQVSLSTGAISGIYKVSSVDDQSRYLGPVIETDAAVNPGSDGGPLSDAEGNLLGIMSLAFSRTRWLGLAIPTHRLIEALPELKALRRVRRPVLSGQRARAWALERAFAEAAQAAKKATVSLLVVREGEKNEAPRNRAQEVPRERKAYPRGRGRVQLEARRPALGVCSGVIVEANGTLVTSAYPFSGKKRIAKVWVFLADGTRREAKLLGKDTYHDLAVLRIQGKGGGLYPYLKPAAEVSMATGQSIAVLGRSEAPGGLTLNAGRISAKDRFRKTCDQISARINYGNLGGPVIDLGGRLVGLATKLAEKSPWRQNCGVGFMLKASRMAQSLPDLKAGKKIERPKRPFLGIMAARGALDVQGARIARVLPNAPAAQGGLRNGDTISAFNGQAVRDWTSLVQAIRQCKIGQRVKVRVRRGTKVLNLDVTVGARE